MVAMDSFISLIFIDLNECRPQLFHRRNVNSLQWTHGDVPKLFTRVAIQAYRHALGLSSVTPSIAGVFYNSLARTNSESRARREGSSRRSSSELKNPMTINRRAAAAGMPRARM